MDKKKGLERTNLDQMAIALLGYRCCSITFLSDTEMISIANNIFTLIAYNFGTPILWYALG